MKKLKAYFIDDILNSTNDVFEKAKISLLFQLNIMFFIIYLIPFTIDILLGFDKLIIFDFIVLTLLITMLFIIKRQKNITKSANLFSFVSFISSFFAALIYNNSSIDAVAISWLISFLVMSSIIQTGWYRIIFCFFLHWIPILFVYVNYLLNGKLSIDLFVQKGANSSPIFLILIPIGILLYTIWTSISTIGIAQITILNQKNIIDKKNIKITDSITYAKRIQIARLPDKDLFTKCLPNSFIIFKPKDIVSGDFYFFKKTEKSIFVAAADCTGHGVPGAFMSMIGSIKLEDACIDNAEPSEILKSLNCGIKLALNQTNSNNSTRDGMDIGICEIIFDSQKLLFAGANRPLWIIRKGQNIVEEIKPTKKAIGGFTDLDQVFENNEINFNLGDTIYLTTDGYADQFGGTENRKLMTKKFKEILVEIQTLSMNDQKNHLNDFFKEWKRNTHQLDDILVIGIRF
ncbi:MAG: hypothetical protein EAZ27_12770 [Cytophagales bacterium]|nr:MAG: hypothetical protein EAZ27_12770 [Cytophagales bacterium]